MLWKKRTKSKAAWKISGAATSGLSAVSTTGAMALCQEIRAPEKRWGIKWGWGFTRQPGKSCGHWGGWWANSARDGWSEKVGNGKSTLPRAAVRSTGPGVWSTHSCGIWGRWPHLSEAQRLCLHEEQKWWYSLCRCVWEFKALCVDSP